MVGLEIGSKIPFPECLLRWPSESNIYPRELFQWAASVFTSRSFTSQWLTTDAAECTSMDPGRATDDGEPEFDQSSQSMSN